MSRRCQISNKGSLRGNNVSHANNKTRTVRRANLHKKRLFDSQSGKWVTLKVSSRVLRTIDRKGLHATLKEAGMKLEDFQA